MKDIKLYFTETGGKIVAKERKNSIGRRKEKTAGYKYMIIGGGTHSNVL